MYAGAWWGGDYLREISTDVSVSSRSPAALFVLGGAGERESGYTMREKKDGMEKEGEIGSDTGLHAVSVCRIAYRDRE